MVIVVSLFVIQPLYSFTLDNMVMIQQYNSARSTTVVTLNQHAEADTDSESIDISVLGTINTYKATPKTGLNQTNEAFIHEQLNNIRQQYHSVEY